MVNPGDAFPPGEDHVARTLKDLQRQIDLLGSARSLESSSIGAGGLTIKNGGSITVEPGGNITLSSGTFSASTVNASTSMSTPTMSVTGNETVGGTLNVTGASYFPQAYNNPVTTGTYYAAYLNGGDYRLGRTASSRRYKQDISTMPVPEQAILALRIVQFRWKAEVEAGRDQGYDFGVIAEELHELGLTPWVFYNDEGKPEGVHYERLFLAALPVIQRLATDIDAIRRDADDIRRRLDAAGL